MRPRLIAVDDFDLAGQVLCQVFASMRPRLIAVDDADAKGDANRYYALQ